MKLLKKSMAILLVLLTVFSVMSFLFVSASAGDGIFVLITDKNATPAAGSNDKPYATYDSETGYWEGVAVGNFSENGYTYNHINFFSVILYDGQLLKILSEERPHTLMLRCTCGRFRSQTDAVDNIFNQKIYHTCEYVLSGFYHELGHVKATVDGVITKPTYAINVTNGRSSSSYAEVGTTVTLEADQIDGKVFSHWEINGATVADKNAKETSFTMNNTDVIAEAIYDDCDCKCHTGNIFIEIIIFLQNLFGMNQFCGGCGGVHINIIF